VFDNPAGINGPVTKARNGWSDVGYFQTNFMADPSNNCIDHLFTRSWVATDSVSPHAGPGGFGERAPGDQNFALCVYDVTRKSQVEGSVGGVNGGFIGGSHWGAIVVDQDDLF